jgi:ATP adenylyltransferase/5',5'''-P-1,P-4-tetraphosphate phosphorylase II
MMLVPRRKERAFNEISVNSVGFAGSILFKNLQQYTQYQSTKPEALIADISFASERELDEAIAALHSSD